MSARDHRTPKRCRGFLPAVGRVAVLSAVGLAAILLAVAGGGCAFLNPRQGARGGGDRSFEMAGAREALGRFMEARLQGDEEAARSLLTGNGREQFQRSSGLRLSLAGADPEVTGYRTTRESKGVGLATFEVRLSESSRERAYGSMRDESLTVVKQDGAYRIDGGRAVNRMDLFPEDGALYRTTIVGVGEGPQEAVVALDELPRTFRPQGAGPGTEFGVGREGFGPVAIAPDGERAAFISQGLHPLLATVKLEDRRIQGIDLYFEGRGEMIMWSATGKFLASQVLHPSGFSRVHFYQADGGAPVKVGLGEQFPAENFALSLVRWLPAADRFIVRADPGPIPPEDKETLGLWAADLVQLKILRPAATARR